MGIGNMGKSSEACKCNSKRDINVQTNTYEKRSFSNSGHITTGIHDPILLLIISIDMVSNRTCVFK